MKDPKVASVESGRRRDGEDGVISIVIALSMIVFVGFLAIVVDLGQIYVARGMLVTATDAAVSVAAEHLAFGGCTEYDEARALAQERLDDVSANAAIEEFNLRYGATTVTDETQCAALATDERVGRLDLVASDRRTLIFAGAFTSGAGATTSTTSVEWGYVEGATGEVWPFSLCSAIQPYQDYLEYLRLSARHEMDPTYPAPDPAVLLDPFDMEVDDFDTNQASVDPLGVGPDENITPGHCDPGAGRFVGLNLGSADHVATQAAMEELVTNLSPHIVSIDPASHAADCGDGAENEAGRCRGIGTTESPDGADTLPKDPTPFRDLVDRTFTILVHDTVACEPSGPPPGWCRRTHPVTGAGRDDNDARRARRYPVVNIVRVKLLCVRMINGIAASPTATHGSNCTMPDLNWTWTSDTAPNEPMVRLQFVVEEVVREGQLTSTPTYWGDPTGADLTPPEFVAPFSSPTYYGPGHLFTGHLGMHICAVDGVDNCVL